MDFSLLKFQFLTWSWGKKHRLLYNLFFFFYITVCPYLQNHVCCSQTSYEEPSYTPMRIYTV